MTQKELTCRGLEVWRHGVRHHVGRTEYYRTTPANSSPKFCWLNGKAHKANIMEELTYISRMWPVAPHTGLNLEITDKHHLSKARCPSLVVFKTGSTFKPDATANLELTDVAYPGSRFRLLIGAALPGTLRFEP